MFGVEPSEIAAAGCGPWVDRSAAIGTHPTHNMATAKPTGTRQPRWKKSDASRTPSASSGARKRARANRSAQATTRLARIAVLVQNSSVVGPSSRTDNSATTAPNTIRETLPSGTVLGSDSMNRAKIKTSGEVTRICQSDLPHRGVRCQLATMQWSGTKARAKATRAVSYTHLTLPTNRE